MAGILALVPADAESVAVYDLGQVRREEPPEALRHEAEDLSGTSIEELGVLADELKTLVFASGDDWYLLVVEGGIDFAHVMDQLEDGDYEDSLYRGFEVWEGAAWPNESVALLQDQGRMVIGDAEGVRSVLRMLDRGSGSLLDDTDSDLGRALKRAGEGWISTAQEQCPGYEVGGCRAVGVSLRRGDDDYLIEVTIAVLFRNDRTAESEMDELERQIEEDSSFEFDIDDVRLDGDFVIVTASGDEDDLFGEESPAPVTPIPATRDAPNTRAPDASTRDDHGDSAGEATLATVGDAVTGVLGHAGDLDYFAFAAEQGQTYQIDVELGTLDDSVAVLFDSDERELAFDDDGGEFGGSRIIWTAAESGTHYVAVAGWSSSDTGSYTIAVTAIDDAPVRAPSAPNTRDDHGDLPDAATFIAVGDTVTGEMGHGGDVDYFAFAAERGQLYRIDVALGTLDDSIAVLFDSRERELAFDDDSGESLGSRITWTAAESGTHYVAVAGWGNDTGSYTLTVTATLAAPDVPANQRYHYEGESIVLSWDASANADFYRVYYDDFFDSACSVHRGSPSFCEELATNLTSTSYTHAQPDRRENYYWVVACNRTGCSDVDSEKPAHVAGSPPDPPANQRYHYEEGSIVLGWDASANTDFYRVYYDDFFDSACSVRSGGPSFCEELATNLASTSYTHAQPHERENYYWVVACNRFGCSAIDSENPARELAR